MMCISWLFLLYSLLLQLLMTLFCCFIIVEVVYAFVNHFFMFLCKVFFWNYCILYLHDNFYLFIQYYILLVLFIIFINRYIFIIYCCCCHHFSICLLHWCKCVYALHKLRRMKVSLSLYVLTSLTTQT